MLRKTAIKSRSAKQAKRERQWRKIVDECKAERGDRCECGCGRGPTEGHHKQGRGPALYTKANCLLLFHDCHMRATRNPAEAYRLGISVKRNGKLDLSWKYGSEG